MDYIIFVHDRLVAFRARLCPRLTGLKVSLETSDWHIQLAILTKFGPELAMLFMLPVLDQRKLLLAVLAVLFFMKLLLMFFFGINIIHFPAGLALLNISSAVAEMSGHFRFSK